MALKSNLISAFLGGLIAASLILTFKPGPAPESSTAPLAQPRQETSEPPSYARAVARATPAVVNIFTSKVTTERQAPGFTDPLGNHYPGGPFRGPSRKHREASLGSGVIVSADGYVLTNLHILEGASGIKVVLADGRNVRVSFVGKDSDTDLAILRLEGANTPSAIPIGRSGDLDVGDVVLAIGNPFGVGQTVTQGIVSATGRTHLGISEFENFIQTDAAINPGNSGGALINAQGELVGINTAIFSESGGSHGIGFAVPVDLAMSVLRQIRNHGQVSRGWIGITGQDVTPEIQAAFGLRDDAGIMISGVLENGPADQAGLRPGDVITHIDERPLRDVQDLLQIVSDTGPDREIRISGWRGNDPYRFDTVTTARPTTPP
jgi:serine protease DegS